MMQNALSKDSHRQWDKAPYEVDELSTNKKSHITDEVLAQIPAHIFIAKFRDAEGDNIKTTIMPREIWTLHKRPEVASVVRPVHLKQFFRLLPWGTNYMRAHELMSSIQYDRKAMLTDSDGSKVEVLITKETVNKALQLQPRTYDMIPKTKAIDNEKEFLNVKGNKFKYSDLIYSELELPLRLISQHFRVQKPPSSATSSRTTRSRKGLSDDERTDIDKDQDLDEFDHEDIPKGAEAKGPSEYERSDEEDTSIPLEKKSKKPRSREQILMDEAMAREDEEELEHIQADPPPSSSIVPPALPSSPITPFPPASTPRTPPSPTTLDPPRSPPTLASPQQQQPSINLAEVPSSSQPQGKEDQPEDKANQEKEKADIAKPRTAKAEQQIPLMQFEEPTKEEAYEEVKSFDYTKIILTLSRQFQCQRVVVQERDFQRERAQIANEEVNNLRTVLELSKLIKKEAQNNELIKNEKKLKEQLKYKDSRLQKITASYNTVKNTLTALLQRLLQNQEPASTMACTSDSATVNTFAALQVELQTEKLQRQLLVSGFMSQTAQHEAKVK
ncbi:hypothetical protein L7F22_034372 [Adiantum nelumboides]|nr:hypothetical protein [Adiantum nelumboides]